VTHVSDPEAVGFLQWALPRLALRWPGFRRVRGQVRKRLARRLAELGLDDLGAYQVFLEVHPSEWATLDALCRVAISRFYRDHGEFVRLEREVLPALARRYDEVRCWSAGCASGEEPYSLAIVWKLRLQAAFPGVRLRVVATDAEKGLLERARRGCYAAGTLKELPAELRAQAFVRQPEGLYRLRDELREGVTFLRQDLRDERPDGPFQLILCRNLVFTYFDEALQRRLLGDFRRRLAPGGELVIGRHERLPDAEQTLVHGLQAPHA
jgi:chemotaxis protein methyltransferase CheR